MAAPRSPREVADWAARTQEDLSKLLARREASTHRVLTLTESYAKLTALNIKQDVLFREALACIEHGLYRPAHVSAWAAFIDFVHEWCVEPTRLAKLQATREKWTISSVADFREQKDFQLLEAMKAAGLISNSVMKGCHGLLNKRNECAHPDDYVPTINDTLGYADEVMKRIALLQK